MQIREKRSSRSSWRQPSLFGQATLHGASGDLGIYTKDGKIGVWHGLLGRDRDYPSKAVVNNGEWHHVALTSDEQSGIALYLNGRLVASGSPVSGPLNGTAFAVGGSFVHGRFGNAHSCTIDEMMIWDRALSKNEITDLHLLRYSGAKN